MAVCRPLTRVNAMVLRLLAIWAHLRTEAAAVLSDLGDPSVVPHFMDDWRPRARLDTWFGPDPPHFLRHVLAEGKIHRRGVMPDEIALR